MKKFLLLLVLLCGAIGIGRAQAPTGMIQSNNAGDIVSVTLALTNPDGFAACAFQCDVELPDGLIAQEEGENAPILNNAPNHIIASHYITAEKKYRILCYSMTNAALPENASVTFKVQCASEGSFEYTLSGIELANDKSESKTDVGITPQEPETPEGKIGDINGDNILDVNDITTLVTKILNDDTDNKCNVNGDNVVDINDITALITIIINQ